MDSFSSGGRELTEAELVICAQHGERNAFNALIRLHARGVINVIYRMCGNVQVAEDAAQETFIQAWQHLASYRPHTSLRSWLYRIAVNSAIDMLRRDKRILPGNLEDMQLKDPHPGPEGIAAQGERAATVQRAVLSLPEASRTVLVLREYEGMSYQEIAEALDIPLGTVMSRLNYARRLLKGMLEQELSAQTEAEYVHARS